MAKGKMLANEQIQCHHGNSDGKCALCGQVESINHIVFLCVLVSFMWSGIREAFGVQWNPKNLPEFLLILNQLTPSLRQSFWVLFAAESRALWLIRNKLSIEKSFPKQPADCFFKNAMFLQLWRPLLKEKHVDKLNIMVGALHSLYRQTRVVAPQDQPLAA
jgi:hypothetical protein